MVVEEERQLEAGADRGFRGTKTDVRGGGGKVGLMRETVKKSRRRPESLVNDAD